MTRISETGCWLSTDMRKGKHDAQLAAALVEFFREQTVIDFGCGTGFYVHAINETADCRGYDGNPNTPDMGGVACEVLDLAEPVEVDPADWVLSLEVGEHLPRQYEATFIENLHKHNRQGIVLSWARPGQGGIGHCNERSQDYLSEIFESLNYVRDRQQETAFREVAQRHWFRNNIMVLRKTGSPASASMNGSSIPKPHR